MSQYQYRGVLNEWEIQCCAFHIAEWSKQQRYDDVSFFLMRDGKRINIISTEWCLIIYSYTIRRPFIMRHDKILWIKMCLKLTSKVYMCIISAAVPSDLHALRRAIWARALVFYYINGSLLLDRKARVSSSIWTMRIVRRDVTCFNRIKMWNVNGLIKVKVHSSVCIQR